MTRAAAVAAAIGSLVVALGGCGGSSGQAPGNGAGPHLDASIQVADCTDWKRADAAERLGTVRQLRDFAGGPVVGAGSEGGRGAILDDKKAYDLLQGYCANQFARAFKLYKLYERAAAFGGHQP